MVDLVATCPKGFWEKWVAEGDPAGRPWSGTSWGWFTQHSKARLIKPGDRLYVVAHGRLRGYAPVVALQVLSFHPDHRPEPRSPCGSYVDVVDVATLTHWTAEDWRRWTEGQWCIVRHGDAVAVTIDEAVPGFRGLRQRWWDRAAERPFPDWRTAGVRRAA